MNSVWSNQGHERTWKDMKWHVQDMKRHETTRKDMKRHERTWKDIKWAPIQGEARVNNNNNNNKTCACDSLHAQADQVAEVRPDGTGGDDGGPLRPVAPRAVVEFEQETAVARSTLVWCTSVDSHLACYCTVHVWGIMSASTLCLFQVLRISCKCSLIFNI